MAQTGFTPISLYYTATAAAVPTAGNLVAGELALNNNDGKLFYKDSSGVVQTIASKAGNVNVSSFSAGTTGLTPNTTTTGAVTLAGTLASANGGTGQTNITFPSSGGTAMVSGNMPAFSAYAGSSTTITNATWTKVIFDTELFDTNSNFASSRFTPTVAGYYQLSTSMQSGFTASFLGNAFYKNGSLFQYGAFIPATSLGVQSGSSALIYFNGSTDYVEIYVYQATGSSATITSSVSSASWFSGILVRTA